MLFATSRDNSLQSRKNSQIVLFICRWAWKEPPGKAAQASNTPLIRPRGEANAVSMSANVSLQDCNLVTAPLPFTKLAFVLQTCGGLLGPIMLVTSSTVTFPV